MVFRILVSGWMVRWLQTHKDQISSFYFSVGAIGMAIIIAVNLCLFYRVLVSDKFMKPVWGIRVGTAAHAAKKRE